MTEAADDRITVSDELPDPFGPIGVDTSPQDLDVRVFLEGFRDGTALPYDGPYLYAVICQLLDDEPSGRPACPCYEYSHKSFYHSLDMTGAHFLEFWLFSWTLNATISLISP